MATCNDCIYRPMCYKHECYGKEDEQICKMFKNKADVVEVKHGEWKWNKRFANYTCSVCNNWDLKTPNYCSNCGAKMDGGKAE